MSKDKDEMIIKYTLMPLNEDDDYEHFFSLSLRELAKNTKDKSLLAPLIIYNSELDVPMDNDLEDYTVYCNESQILDVIRKQEVNDVFRTLILHGFDIDLDEMKNTYVGIARRNQADLCINIIQDTGIDSNITLYIDSSIEKSDEKLWEMQKKEMNDEIEEFINSYDSYDSYDYSPEDLENVETFLEALLGGCDMLPDSKSKDKEKDEDFDAKIIPISLDSIQSIGNLKDVKTDEEIIAFSFENNDDVVKISCIDKELFVIEENEYEIALNMKQMKFIVDCYERIMECLEEDEDN